MRKPRGGQRGRTYTISCTDEELEEIKAGAAKAGMKVSPWFVLCALTVEPWPEKHRRLVLDAGQQRAVLRGVEEIARGLGVAGGEPPRFTEDLRALLEARLRGMATRGRRDKATALLREVFGEDRAEAIAAAVIPEAPAPSAMPETPGTPETPKESGEGEEPGPEPRPGTDAEPQGSLL